jgi:hypothetical protein
MIIFLSRRDAKIYLTTESTETHRIIFRYYLFYFGDIQWTRWLIISFFFNCSIAALCYYSQKLYYFSKVFTNLINIFLTQRTREVRKEILKYIFKKLLKGLACFASPLRLSNPC